MSKQILEQYIKLALVEAKMREADVTSGDKVPHGSRQHIKDLEIRINDLVAWRDRQRKGSEARANYARLIQRLRSELNSAKRTASKTQRVTESVGDEERWQSLVGSNDAGVKGIVSVIKNALPRELGKLKKNINREIDNGTYPDDVTPEFIDWLIKQRKLEQGPAVADASHIDRQSRAANAASRKTKRMFLDVMIERKRNIPLTEGGAVGHLQHIYDNVDLTFAEIKDVIRNASEGKLEKSSEKLDGMNLVFSFDVRTSSLRAARTGSDIKGGGMDASGLAKKFFGRGNVEAAFNDSFKVLNDALTSLGTKEKLATFGANANRWYSIEIIYTSNPNTINYDSNNVVFHGWPIFEVQPDGSVSQTDDDTGIDILSKNIDRMQAAVSSKDWRVRGPSLLNLKKISDGSIVQRAISDIESAMNAAGVSDSDTILDYMRSMMSEKVATLGLPEKIAKMATERAIEAPGAPGVPEIKKVAGLEYSRIVAQFVKSAESLRKAMIEPIEMAIHRFAIEVLRGLSSTLIASSDDEVSRLRSQVSKAISAIEASGNQDAMAILNKEMKRLGNVENIAAAMEGMVFFFKGKAYKFTGVFSPVNQILGLFKYGRGSNIPAMNIGESKSFHEHTTPSTHGKYHMSNSQTEKLIKEVVKLVVEGSGGASYEESVLAAIASVGASGKIVTVTGSDATLPDADITINGKIYNVEVKMNDKAQMGGGSVGWNQAQGFFATGKDHVKEEVQPIADLMNSSEGDTVVKAIKRFIKFLNAKGAGVAKKITGFPMSGFLVSAWDEAVAEGLLVPLNVKIEDDIEFVFRHYAKKNVHYIQIGGKGLFYLSNNPAKLPVPQLSGRNILEFRASRSGSGGKPTGAGGAFRVQARLKIDGTSPYTLDDPASIAQLLNAVGGKKKAPAKRLVQDFLNVLPQQ